MKFKNGAQKIILEKYEEIVRTKDGKPMLKLYIKGCDKTNSQAVGELFFLIGGVDKEMKENNKIIEFLGALGYTQVSWEQADDILDTLIGRPMLATISVGGDRADGGQWLNVLPNKMLEEETVISQDEIPF